MEFVKLNAESREGTKKGVCRKLRGEGKIPAVLYGRTLDPKALSVSVKDLEEAIKQTETLDVFLSLDVAGENTAVMLKELQQNPMTGEFVHADFYAVEMDRKIIAAVPVVTTGVSKGVDRGGVLQVIRRKLDVSCLPEAVPTTIEIDVTELGMGKSVHVNEVAAPEGVEILADVNFTVVTVLIPKGLSADADEEEGAAEA